MELAVRQDGWTMPEIAADIRSLRRPRDTRLLGGLCAAVSDRFGVDILIVRVLAVLAMAFTSAIPLVYLLGLMVVPAAAEVLGANGTFVRTSRRRRQLLAYLVFFAAADSLFDNSLPTNKVFAVALIVGGLLLMQIRNRTLNSQQSYVPTSEAGWTGGGGWTATPPQTASEFQGVGQAPPRWGLAGEVANPQLWNPQASEPPVRTEKQSVWQTQFGNLALVTLVGVLAIGLWSNTSQSSPVRRAAIQERLENGPVAIATDDELGQLDDLALGDGSFEINLAALAVQDDKELELSMGSGRLELILPAAVDVYGSVSVDDDETGTVLVRAFGKALAAPAEFSGADSATREETPPALTLDITADSGLVCVRRITDPSSVCKSGSPTSARDQPTSEVPIATSVPLSIPSPAVKPAVAPSTPASLATPAPPASFRARPSE
jgi:phage shock protein PspC (stress-responsive transcriptional regulator)